ncbi:winged helix-turn-helix domain-containing protein [Marinagarivorans algicola]
MRPFLEVAKSANGKEVKLRDVINQLAQWFNISEEDRDVVAY